MGRMKFEKEFGVCIHISYCFLMVEGGLVCSSFRRSHSGLGLLSFDTVHIMSRCEKRQTTSTIVLKTFVIQALPEFGLQCKKRDILNVVH